MEVDQDNDWELSKENVQPLRSGRRMGDLKQALSNDNAAIRNAIQDFEMQLRRTEGGAQLDVWFSYVCWMEQHNATGNKEISDLLQRCIHHYKNNKEFNQHEKYVHIWIKLSEQMDDPGELFNYMFDQDIGTALAWLYKSWAEHFELIGSYKKADELYNLGINRGAHPVDMLQNSKSAFEVRLAKLVIDNSDSPPEQQQKARKVLGGLKVDKAGKVGNDRLKNKAARSGLSTGVKTSLKSSSNRGAGFAIFGDENVVAALHTVGTKQIKELPIAANLHAENKKTMESLKGAKVKQAGSIQSTTKFEIFTEEEHANQENPTPRQVIVSARKPLSTRKEENNPYHFYDPSKPNDPKVVVKYCKNIIYMGAKEVSFEELKAQLPKYLEERVVAARSKLAFDNIDMIKESACGVVQVDDKPQTDVCTQLQRTEDFFDSDEEIIGGNKFSDVTNILDTIGPPQVQSTAVINLQDINHVKFDVEMLTPAKSEVKSNKPVANFDVHMQTPENLFSRKDFVVSEQVLNELDETKRLDFDTKNLRNVDINQHFHMLNSTTHVLSSMPDHNKIEKYQPTISTEENVANVECQAVELSENLEATQPSRMTREQAAIRKEELKQLKKLSALSGVDLNIFGDNNLKLDLSLGDHDFFKQKPDSVGDDFIIPNKMTHTANNSNMTPADDLLATNGCSLNITEGNKSDKSGNDSLINQLKSLKTFDSFEAEKTEFRFHENVFAKTPTGIHQGGFSNKPMNDFSWQQSPTVNTKNAKNGVQSMFATTLDQDQLDLSFDGVTKVDQSFESQFKAAPDKTSDGVGLRSNTKQEQEISIFNDFSDKQQPSFQKPQQLFIYSDAEIDTKKSSGSFSIFKEASTKQVSSQAFHISNQCVQQEPNEKEKKSSFTIFSDESVARDTADKHPTMVSGAPLSTTMFEDITSNVGFPGRPVSTPFGSRQEITTVTFEHNFSDIAAASRSMKSNNTTTFIDSHTGINLSTIQERSNEESDDSSFQDDQYDAFNSELRLTLLKKVESDISSAENFIKVSGPLPKLQGASTELQIGPRHFRISKCILKGAFSATYMAMNNLKQKVSLTISKDNLTNLLWDFYISNEIDKRLSLHPEYHKLLSPTFLHHNLLCRYSDSLCVESMLYSEGTLKDLIALYKKHNCTIDEPLAMLYAHEILRIVHTLHSLDILHCDLKPSNFIQADCELTEAGPLAIRCLKLKGFSNSLDLKMFKPEVMFNGSSQSDSFDCEEMREERLWKYQVDYFATAATIHSVVFHTHMNTYTEPKSKMLEICNSPRRDWNVELWSVLFSTLINSSRFNNILPSLINMLSQELNAPGVSEKLQEAIVKKTDLLMDDDD